MENLNNKKDYKEHECLESEASFTSQSAADYKKVTYSQRKHVMKKQIVYYVKVLQCH